MYNYVNYSCLGATSTPAFGAGLGGGLNFGTGTSTAATTGNLLITYR